MKTKNQTMSRTRIFFTLLSCIYAVLPNAAQAELRLEKWKNYGQMAEQSAICASFAKLMEAQSVLNPDLGALWKERRKFAGAVIRKAVFLELGRDSTETEIDKLITNYRDWVLSSLMITDEISADNGSNTAKKAGTSHEKIETLINRQCKSLFQQGDEMIRKQRPELVYLLENLSVEQAKSSSSQHEKKPATKIENSKIKPSSSHTGKAVQLFINGNSSFTLNLPSQKPVSSNKQSLKHASTQTNMSANIENKLTPKLVQISGPVSRPVQMQIKTQGQASNIKAALSAGTASLATSPTLISLESEQSLADSPSVYEINALKEQANIAAARLPELLEKHAEAIINLQIPGRPAEIQQEKVAGNFFAQLGAFAQLENAKTEKQRLENKFSVLFTKLPLHISEIKDSSQRFYRIETIGLSRKHINTLCDVLWPHKIACVPKPGNTH